MLPNWDPDRLARKIPFVAAALGGRRMGKSTLVHHLLQRMSSRFDLVISFQGTAACSPEMRTLMEKHYDPRFVFSAWNQPLMDRLQEQQERLKLEGTNRQVVVLVDDIVLTSKDEDAMAHLCLRGRHFNISVLAASVSYTCLPKRCRRSLDCLFLYSCPMSGDCQILCQEYAARSRMARYCLQNLQEYECLVMETLERKQRLYNYRVPLQTDTVPQTREQLPSEESKTLVAPGSPERSQKLLNPSKTDALLCCNEDLGTSEGRERAGSE